MFLTVVLTVTLISLIGAVGLLVDALRAEKSKELSQADQRHFSGPVSE